MLFDGIEGVAEQTGLGNVALSGGCFANRLLLSELLALLNKADLNFYLHREMPTTDGGIALGQEVVAAATVARE
jgi:hydrogenase maturation protein HypF